MGWYILFGLVLVLAVFVPPIAAGAALLSGTVAIFAIIMGFLMLIVMGAGFSLQNRPMNMHDAQALHGGHFVLSVGFIALGMFVLFKGAMWLGAKPWKRGR